MENNENTSESSSRHSRRRRHREKRLHDVKVSRLDRRENENSDPNYNDQGSSTTTAVENNGRFLTTESSSSSPVNEPTTNVTVNDDGGNAVLQQKNNRVKRMAKLLRSREREELLKSGEKQLQQMKKKSRKRNKTFRPPQKQQQEEYIKEDDLFAAPFAFQQRRGRLNFREIARVDLERVVQEVDITALQRHVENIAFADVDVNDLRAYTDEHFLKLFRLTQLTIEYLLNVQDTLYTSAMKAEKRCHKLQKYNASLVKKMDHRDDEIALVSGQLRQHRKTLKLYEKILKTTVQDHNIQNQLELQAAQRQFQQETEKAVVPQAAPGILGGGEGSLVATMLTEQRKEISKLEAKVSEQAEYFAKNVNAREEKQSSELKTAKSEIARLQSALQEEQD
eukprot:g3967.t1